MPNKVLRILAAVVYVIGITIVVHYAGWEAGGGVVLAILGNDLDNIARKREGIDA